MNRAIAMLLPARRDAAVIFAVIWAVIWAAVAGIVTITPAEAADPALQFKPAKSPGGIAFHYRYDTTTPFAAINFGLRDLYALTTPGKEALGALGGAFVMQGADGVGQTEFVEQLKDLAANASVSFGPFATQGGVRAPAATLAPAMALLAAGLKGAKPTDKFLVRLKQQAMDAEAQGAIRAETIAQRAALRLALGDHPFTRSSDPRRFERVTRDDLGEWRGRMLDRAKLRVVASGRVLETEAGQLIDKAFGDLPERLEPPTFKWPEIQVPAFTIVIEYDTPQSAVMMVGLTSIETGEQAETAMIANAVLGGSNSRLWSAVREKLGSTYGASSGLLGVGPGKRLLRITGAVDNDQVKASVEALRSTYATWHGKGVTAAELKSVAGRVVNDFRSAFDEPARANGLVLGMLLANRPVDALQTYESRIATLTPDDVNAFIAARFPAPDRLLTVIVTPRAEGLAADCTIRSLDEIERCRR